MAYRRRKGKTYKKASNPFKGGKKTIQSQINSLKKVVVKDHRLLSKSVDYTDYLFPETIAVVSYRTWNYASLIVPNTWAQTCRRSNAVMISPESQLKEMTVSFCCNHGTSNYETSWFVAVVRAKKDWVPNSSAPSTLLRDLVDFTDMGAGNAPILNADKFTILKSWSLTTNSISQGEPSQATQRRTHRFKMNQTLRASNQTVATGDQNWLSNNETDFDTSDRIYVLHYANTPSNASWGVLYNPSFTLGVRFSCCTI